MEIFSGLWCFELRGFFELFFVLESGQVLVGELVHQNFKGFFCLKIIEYPGEYKEQS